MSLPHSTLVACVCLQGTAQRAAYELGRGDPLALGCFTQTLAEIVGQEEGGGSHELRVAVDMRNRKPNEKGSLLISALL